MANKQLIKFIFELAQLRRIKHEGFRLSGVDCPLSVADHSLRAAQIGFFLARMEKYENPYEIVTMLVFHDIGECRTGDIHKVANRYIKADEEGAVKDQLQPLEDGSKLLSLWKQCEKRTSIPGVIAKDADYLEKAFTAKEYTETGHKSAVDWINNVRKHLQTKSAKVMLEEMVKMTSTDWWDGLKLITN